MKRLLTLLFFLLFAASFAHADIPVQTGQTSMCFQVHAWKKSDGTDFTGLAYNTSGMACSYHREASGATATAITMASSTLGTYTSGAFKEISSSLSPGNYEFCPPDAAFASGMSGPKTVVFTCYGVTDMATIVLRVQVAAPTNTTAWNGSSVATPTNSGYPLVDIHSGTGTNQLQVVSGMVGIAPAGIPYNAYAARGTAQSATGTTLRLASAEAFADDEPNDNSAACIVSATTGAGQCQCIRDYVSSTDTATVDTWVTTPTGTITYDIIPAPSCTIKTTTFASGAINGAAIATDAIGALEIADSAIDAGAIATDSIGASEIAADAIGSSEIAADAVGSSEIAADAIGASEIAADAIGGSEIATDAIGALEISDSAIDAGAIAADAIASSEIATTAVTEIAQGGLTQEDGTAQAVGTKTIRLASAETYQDDALNDNNSIWVVNSTNGKGQVLCVCDYASATDQATLCKNWPILPTGTITYRVVRTPNCNPLKWPLSR